jgi:hypothetical protein
VENVMKKPSAKAAAIAVLVAAAAAAALPLARAQVQATANYVPIGVAASGSASTAWFHQPSSGQVLACHAPADAAAAGGIRCVTARLP